MISAKLAWESVLSSCPQPVVTLGQDRGIPAWGSEEALSSMSVQHLRCSLVAYSTILLHSLASPFPSGLIPAECPHLFKLEWHVRCALTRKTRQTSSGLLKRWTSFRGWVVPSLCMDCMGFIKAGPDPFMELKIYGHFSPT